MEETNLKNFDTPILFLIFNRPDTTQKVFDEIRKVKPKKLFVVADGPRNDEEAEKCKQTREIIGQVNWSCDVQKNYSEKNLGCKMRVSSGIDWFFENVEEGIILEDDTVPDQSFFYFCKELLKRHRDDKRIGMISGNNFQQDKIRGDGSYYFSHFHHIWGWATWKRSWKYYDVEMKNFPSFNKLDISLEKGVQNHYMNIFEKTYKKQIDTWDHQWMFALISHNVLSITPNVNLVTNIGFNENATHTTQTNSASANITRKSIGKLIHPSSIIANMEAEKASATFFGLHKRSLIQKIYSKIKKYGKL